MSSSEEEISAIACAFEAEEKIKRIWVDKININRDESLPASPTSTSSSPPVRLTFRATPGAGSPPRTPSSSQPWDAVLRGDTLYVTPPGYLAEGSREAFVALLEAAEDQLKCKHVVVVSMHISAFVACSTK
ncbi:unnamed protein product [Ceutorhynchus assimilis]|uniref:Ornithine decarboxylase antizyme n=1 Tax=Ceutorhynchus assimilis TaxID=467358 RepID=A0A9N9M8T0_9CUCU|nr:unnamed protein product [Ceutorhynchus assimilis]